MFHRAIEKVYKEYCESKGKEQTQSQDSWYSDNIMLKDSAVWQKVSIAYKIILVLGVILSGFSVNMTFLCLEGICLCVCRLKK